MRSRFIVLLFSLLLALSLAACAGTATPAPATEPAVAEGEEPAAEGEVVETEVEEAEEAVEIEGEEAEEAAETAETMQIKVGIMGPFTGAAASVGQEQLNFARLAVEDFNEATGLDIELVEGDTELDAARAVDVAQRFVSDPELYAIIGPAGSQEVVAVEPIVGPENLVMVSPSATAPNLTESGFETFFRVVPRDDVQGPTDATFMVEQLGADTVWIIDDQSAYSTGLADEVERVLGELGV
ncbi:MAG: branched-chain amino acid ABC transporter substrate-binding protein, partial [Chloroflexota bacterium]|nr:branched-chain amino acid ABC transporter substrate-binding protein [Chloroflexota bacterium]